jgi:hypothetical protein
MLGEEAARFSLQGNDGKNAACLGIIQPEPISTEKARAF